MEGKKENKKLDSKLIINLSEEYKLKIENPEDLELSFFRDIYLSGADVVDNIIEQPERGPKLDKNDPFLNEKQDYNNIIAFCGERGTGKSSAMISFAQSLLRLKDSRESQMFYNGKKLVTKDFRTIQVIDPSLFEEHENIFEVILAQLFSSFEKELSNKDRGSDVILKRELLEQFEKVYENLQTIRKDGQKYDGEALETLDKLACGANLRQNFKELVKRYLNFIVGKGKGDNTYLIIPIDDFDLNVNAAAEMTEQIRKYLMIPNLIVLMAVKIEQLSNAKEQKVRDDFKTLIKAGALHDNPQEIALQYLLKLIPNNRRIKMPVFSSSIENSMLTIINRNEEKSYKNIFQGFQQECYLKGALFLSKREFVNISFLPHTLREFIEFLIVLNRSNSVDDFLMFLINQRKSTTYRHDQIIEKLLILPNSEKNYFVISSIVDELTEKTKQGKRTLHVALDLSPHTKDYFNLLLQPDNKSHNITLGDLLFFFDVILDCKFGNLYKDLIYLLKSIYSIWLTQARNRGLFNDLFELTNGGIYVPYYKDVMRSRRKDLRSQFEINDFKSLSINEMNLEGIMSNDLNSDIVSKIEWLSSFVEYPVNTKQYISSLDTDSILFYYKDDVVPYYKRRMDIGRGAILKNPIFNILNFVTSALDPKNNFDRAFENYFKNTKSDKGARFISIGRMSMVWDIKTWQAKHRLALPFNNIFLFENILSRIDYDLKTAEKGYHSYVMFLFDQLHEILQDINKEEPFLKVLELDKAFITCPIIAPLYSTKSQQEYFDILDALRKQDKVIKLEITKSLTYTLNDDQVFNEEIDKAIKDLYNLRAYHSVRNALVKNQKILSKLGVFNEFLGRLDRGEDYQNVKNQLRELLRRSKK